MSTQYHPIYLQPVANNVIFISRYFDPPLFSNFVYGQDLSMAYIKEEIDDTTFKNFIPLNGDPNAAMPPSVQPDLKPTEAFDFPIVPKLEPLPPEEPASTRNILDCLKKKRKLRNSPKAKKVDDNIVPPVELDEPIRCDICNETYKNNVAFALHSEMHNPDGKFTCHLCDYRNTSKYHIEMHMRAHEGTTKYKCEICGKAFTVSTHAIEHKYFHTGEKPFECDICGKHFMFSWFLTSHRRTQHWELVTGSPLIKYDCTICNKHYTSSTGLKRHNSSKHNIKGVDTSVLCDICGKRLSSKEKLKFHRRTHTGYKPFSCQMCTKSFSRKEQLKEHERVHTGEKPYKCKHCGKGFTQRSPLRIHERTHTGERPYSCLICGKGYISKGVMDTHMKTCSKSHDN